MYRIHIAEDGLPCRTVRCLGYLSGPATLEPVAQASVYNRHCTLAYLERTATIVVQAVQNTACDSINHA